MKIVILSLYSGLYTRGVESFIIDFCRFIGKDQSIKVFQSQNGKKINLNHQVSRFFRWFYLDYFSLKILFFTFGVLPEIIREKPDILIPVNNGWQSILAKIYCLLSGTKLIFQGHAGPGKDDWLNLKLKPNVFVCFSQAQEKWAKEQSNGSIEVIPQGIDLQLFKPGRRESSKKLLLCVSALDDYKNVNLTIQAVARLVNVPLLLVCRGTEKQKNTVNKLGKKLLGQRFTMTTLDYRSLPLIYAKASVFTLVSSQKEAFGRVYLEAMACNVPVVATDDNLRREIIGKAGLFIANPANCRQYAQTLQQALQIKWGQLPRKQAEKFNWEIIAGQYQKLFKKILND